ncbi:helix-turn-helix domain-containing protein [Halopiger thermotolerans]
MALIAEFELHTPVLRGAARAARKLRLEEAGVESEESTLLLRAVTDDADAFEAALEADASVRRYAALEKTAARRLYSVGVTDDAASRLVYSVAADHDVAILEFVVADETVVRARAPSRDALSAYRERCFERSVDVRLRRLYPERDPDDDPYGVTEPQREALRTALSAGYFTVPRETTLAELATAFDITDQALSARLRRGQANLLENTLADDGG